MYQKILVALENGRADKSLLPHVAELAKLHKSKLLLVHVADGWAARNYDQLQLRESQEMIEDRAYLDETAKQLRKHGLAVETFLALGDPPAEILKTANFSWHSQTYRVREMHRHQQTFLRNQNRRLRRKVL